MYTAKNYSIKSPILETLNIFMFADKSAEKEEEKFMCLMSPVTHANSHIQRSPPLLNPKQFVVSAANSLVITATATATATDNIVEVLNKNALKRR